MPAKLTSRSYDLEYILQIASGVINREGGYVSGKKVFENLDKNNPLVSTATHVRQVVEHGDSVSLCTEDVENAKACVEYLLKLNPKNDFEESMKRLVDPANAEKTGNVVTGNFGTIKYICADSDIAFAVCVHMGANRDRSRVKRVADAAGSDYIGEIGERAEFFVKLVEHIYSNKADYNIYRLQDRSGNLGLFFSNLSPEELKVEVGDCMMIKMTPKRQDISNFHGGKETVFNRIKIVKNVGGADA